MSSKGNNNDHGNSRSKILERSVANAHLITTIKDQLKQLEKKEQHLIDKQNQLKKYLSNEHARCSDRRKILEQYDIHLKRDKQVKEGLEKDENDLSKQLSNLERSNDGIINERNYLQLSLNAIDEQIQTIRLNLTSNEEKIEQEYTSRGIQGEIESTDRRIKDITNEIQRLVMSNNRVIEQQSRISLSSQQDTINKMIEQIHKVLQTTINTNSVQQYQDTLQTTKQKLIAIHNQLDMDQSQLTSNFNSIHQLQQQRASLEAVNEAKRYDMQLYKRLEQETPELSFKNRIIQQNLELLFDQKDRIVKEMKKTEIKIQHKQSELQAFNRRTNYLLDTMKMVQNDLLQGENSIQETELNLKEIEEQLVQMNQLFNESQQKLQELNASVDKTRESFQSIPNRSIERFTKNHNNDQHIEVKIRRTKMYTSEEDDHSKKLIWN
ncbi:unnamed protein product [Didymodactylos carnosus]|uniref:Uncharacterized protein n=2 Tax=Didymodactylos carnosus TaxID=1234261 RepID=A0A813WHZ3_9BILA|nr:unnamed protein product [Didymodactylos carnosus]CAF3641753.1 unnamed protein product [Didymodactylos carnosus]